MYNADGDFGLLSNTTKIQNESESQLMSEGEVLQFGCYQIRQRYKMKANHNKPDGVDYRSNAVIKYDKDTK